jgi:hypothetical protein
MAVRERNGAGRDPVVLVKGRAMLEFKFSTAAFVADLVATKSTSATAAVVLAFTFLPMSGGAIKPYELREFPAGISALMNGQTATSTRERVLHPDWGFDARFLVASAEAAPARDQTNAIDDDTQLQLASGLMDEAVLTPVIHTFDASEALAEAELPRLEFEAEVMEEAELMEGPVVEEADELNELSELEMG